MSVIKHSSLNIRKKDIYSFLEYFFIFLMTVNKPFPFDKLTLVLYLFWKRRDLLLLSKNQYVFIIVSVCLACVSFLVNIPNSSIQIFYPILFILAGLIIARRHLNLMYIRNIFSVNIVFGIVCAVMATVTGIDVGFSRNMIEKGFPFLYGPVGFSPTNQVYGTFCILHLLISYHNKKFDIWSVFSIIGLVMTMNRASWVFLFCLWFWYRRKMLLLILCGIGYGFVRYWTELQYIFSTQSLSSRGELRRGVEIAFWESESLLTLLFGYGNSNTSSNIASSTIHETTYVENGLDFIAFAYGYIGLFFVGCVLLLYFYKRIKRGRWMFFSFLFIYLVFEQWLTQEFLASSFMFFFAVILIIEREFAYSKYKKKRKQFSNGRVFSSCN